MMDWGKIAKASTATLLMVLLTLNPITTHPAIAAWGRKKAASPEVTQPSKLAGKLTEVAPPVAIQELRQAFADNQPQVTIQSPRPNEVLNDDTVSVQFQVRDLELFKDKELGLGPHLHVFLDNQPYQAVYDPSKPLVLEKLSPGTHTIRAFASRPWHESFKNEGAYAQTTFHVFTKTGDNSPDPNLPLLTYSRPQATYGAEPIMLDFYLTNAPLHLVAQEDQKDDIADWRIRCTVNGNSFVLDQWQPIYLKGFKPGKNWVQLEFLDENGNAVKNVFNNTARIITYEPGGKDALSKLVRGDLSATDARSIVDANYKPPTPSLTSSPTAQPVPTPVPAAPVVKPTPTPEPSISPTPSVKPSPVVLPAPSPTPQAATTSKLDETPDAIATPESVQPTPDETPEVVAPAPTPAPAAKPVKSPVKNLLGRFRKEPKERKPVTVPVVPPSPSPAATRSPEPITPPKAVEIVPETGAVERPQPVKLPPVEAPKVEASKVEAPEVEVPKAEPPKVELPQTITAPAAPEAVQVDPAPAAKATESQPVTPEKADDLKQKVTSQFDRLRDRLRQTTSRPNQSTTKPALPEVKSAPAPVKTPTTQFPVISAPQPGETSPSAAGETDEVSEVRSPSLLEEIKPAKADPERALTPAQQYYSRLRNQTPKLEPSTSPIPSLLPEPAAPTPVEVK